MGFVRMFSAPPTRAQELGCRALPSAKQRLKSAAARMVWKVPGAFKRANLLGKQPGFRSLVFHDFRDEPSDFTDGLGVTMSPQEFRFCVDFLSRHYHFATLEEVLTNDFAGAHGRPSVLITFDDAYRSVFTQALPVLQERGIPAVFFINSSLIGNPSLSTDNLMTYIANRFGISALVRFTQEQGFAVQDDTNTIGAFLQNAVAPLTREQVRELYQALVSHFGIDSEALASSSDLYLHASDLGKIAESNVEIGNHTLSHSFCRSLTEAELESEISENKKNLEGMVDCRVRAFSLPYGSFSDLTAPLKSALEDADTECIFLVEGLINESPPDFQCLFRISPRRFHHDSELFLEMEILPRMRTIRNQFSSKPKVR